MYKFNMVRYDNHKHLHALFDWMSDVQEQSLYLSQSIFNSIRDFDDWIQNKLKYYFNDFFVLEDDNGTPAGFAYSYEQRLRDGHCKITVYLAPEYRETGGGAIAGFQLMDYLFTYYPFRRIYCEVYSYNTASLEALLQCGLEETGIVREYRYYNGSYHDLVLLTMDREAFYSRYRKLFC